MIKCTKCGLIKPDDQFYSKTGRQQRNSRCISCYRQQQNSARRERRKDPAFRRAEYIKDSNTPKARASALWHDIKRRAKRKGLDFDLTKDWIEARLDTCEVLGVALVLCRDGTGKKSPYAPSVDRLDPDKGYTQDNCQVVAWIYNASKHTFDHDEVVRFAQTLLSAEELKRTVDEGS